MTTPAPAEPRVSDDDPQLRALMALSDIDKMRVGLLAAEDVIKRQDATIKAQAAELAEAREILAGTDAGSLPNDMPLARIAEIRMDERHKYLWQVRDTCTRAEAAEAALKAAREIAEELSGLMYTGEVEQLKKCLLVTLTPKEPTS